MDRKVLIYQSYGSDDIRLQTFMSVSSLIWQLDLERQEDEKNDLDIWIYTDQRAPFDLFFKSEPRVRVIELPLKQFEKWKGENQFVHRVKIEILRSAAGQFKGCLFYCDSDTLFVKSPKVLFSKVNERTSLMHVKESVLEEGQDPLTRKILKFVKKHHFQIANELVGIGPSTEMWNAGFIGISDQNKELLSLVLELTDQTYALYQKHVMEQLAFSFYLQTRTEIQAAESYVLHYWSQKELFQSWIRTYLSAHTSLDDALAHWSELQLPDTREPEPKKETLISKMFRR